MMVDTMDKPAIKVEGIELAVGKLYRATRSVRIFGGVEVSEYGRVKATDITSISHKTVMVLLDYHDNDKLFIKDKFGVDPDGKTIIIGDDDDWKLTMMLGKHIVYVCFVAQEIKEYLERIE